MLLKKHNFIQAKCCKFFMLSFAFHVVKFFFQEVRTLSATFTFPQRIIRAGTPMQVFQPARILVRSLIFSSSLLSPETVSRKTDVTESYVSIKDRVSYFRFRNANGGDRCFANDEKWGIIRQF